MKLTKSKPDLNKRYKQVITSEQITNYIMFRRIMFTAYIGYPVNGRRNNLND